MEQLSFRLESTLFSRFQTHSVLFPHAVFRDVSVCTAPVRRSALYFSAEY